MQRKKNSSAPNCKFYLSGTCAKGNNCAFFHALSVSDKDKVLCSYHILGNCRYGATCNLLHGNVCVHCNKACLHPHNPEQVESHTKLCEKRAALLTSLPEDIIETSNKAECGICLEVVVEKGKRFGLMTGCDHAFCLGCIRAWRSKSKDITNASTMVKSCPTCRQESLFIIPSAVFCVGSLKQTIIAQYKSNLAKTPCKHFEKNGSCPFGADCFFAHLDFDGIAIDSSKMKNIVKNKPPAPSSSMYPFGSDIIDLLSHVTHLHPSNVMDLLMDLLVEDEWES